MAIKIIVIEKNKNECTAGEDIAKYLDRAINGLIDYSIAVADDKRMSECCEMFREKIIGSDLSRKASFYAYFSDLFEEGLNNLFGLATEHALMQKDKKKRNEKKDTKKS